MYAFQCLALLALTASVTADDCGSPASTNVPQIVTYGEPCICNVPLPYSVQVPKSSPVIPGPGRNYDYSIQGPADSGPANVGFEVPIKIETPYSTRSSPDTLKGRSYGVNVQKPQLNLGPVRQSFNFGIQKSVPVQRQYKSINYDIEVQPEIATQYYNFGPLPYAVQTPAQDRSAPSILKGLTSKVDRILLPVNEVCPCPCPDDCGPSSRSNSESCY